jgi:hypothetical protein
MLQLCVLPKVKVVNEINPPLNKLNPSNSPVSKSNASLKDGNFILFQTAIFYIRVIMAPDNDSFLKLVYSVFFGSRYDYLRNNSSGTTDSNVERKYFFAFDFY